MNKIFIVEDDSAIKRGLRFYLEQENFIVSTAAGYDEAVGMLDIILKSDLVILDINLGEKDKTGFDVFKVIKENIDIPVIFLSADDLEVSIVMGLELGADDYITKPFKSRELLARINNILKRKSIDSRTNELVIDDIKIDLLKNRVYKNDKEIILTSLEYKLLVKLFLNASNVLSRDVLLESIWDKEEYVYDNTLTVYIKRLREKIEDDPSNPSLIKTIRNVGYRVDLDE